MRKLIFILIMLISHIAWADEVLVEVSPKNPILGESFDVVFKVKTNDREEPYISFTPYGVSVLGKRSQGLSISTVVINGKFTTTKEQAIVYELSADREGLAFLRGIQVELNGKKIPVKDLSIHILKEARRLPDAFVESEASKTNVFLGEGLNVNYYLYFTNVISANDVKEFPRLNKFIKRFHHINSPVETVEYEGKVMRRILLYSARLYGEKTGNAVLDPMKIGVQIVENTRSNGFGFGTQRFKNVDLASQNIDIQILPLPTEGTPSNFTGLVGDHDFKINVPKSKYLVNEPIEITFEVTGPGALENYDAPVLYQNKDLEQFDTNSEVQEIGLDSGKKTFTYVYLARAPLKIPERKMEFSTFNAQAKRYETKVVTIPAIEVGGTAAVGNAQYQPPSKNNSNKETPSLFPVLEKNELGIMGPMNGKAGLNYFNYLDWLNGFLFILCSIVGFSLYRRYKQSDADELKSRIKRDIKIMKSKGIDYSSLYAVLSALDYKNLMNNGGVSLEDVVEQSDLSKEAKAYFKRGLTKLAERNYATDSKGKGQFDFNEKYFNEILRLL